MTRSKIIFELNQPGTWLETPDQRKAFNTGIVLEVMLTAFYELNAALWNFEDAHDRSKLLSKLMEEEGYWVEKNKRIHEIERELESQDGRTADLYSQAHLLFKREQWAQGTLPRKLEAAFLQLQAHSFLHALAQLGQLMATMGEDETAPPAVRELAQRFELEFPQVNHIRQAAEPVRNSARRNASHRSLTRRRPIRAACSVPPLASVTMSGLYGQTLTHAATDGHTISLDITSDTVKAVQGLIQALLDAFPWKGPHIHHPT
ncbi:hypothetical protein ACMT4L_10335 [Deinococcus sp. A31D244]|uniref:hypothetical protein n=1 Tax=Deinococcus sp. A31D244 TaxID=3397675 RepID=UPI0039DFF046